VFGINDGLVSTIGFVAGVTMSGHLTPVQILVAGIAEVVAATISMACGAFLAAKAEVDFFRAEIERERREIEEMPEREIQEVHDIYGEFGFPAEEREMIVRRLTQDKEVWLRFMMHEELGIASEAFDNPWRVALIMGLSFIVGSLPALLPFLFPVLFPAAVTPLGALKVALPLSVLGAFGLGVLAARVAKGGWLRNGLSFLAVMSLSAAIGFGIGKLIGAVLGFET